MFRFQFLLTLQMISFIVAGLLSACAPDKVSLSQKELSSSSEPELLSQKPSKSEWEVKWEKTLEEAKKEGRLVLYTTIQPEVRQVMAENFEKLAGIKVETIAARGGEISTRLLGERRAGLYMAGAYVGGTTTLLTQLKPAGTLAPVMPLLFLPDVLDTRLWYKGELPFMDKEKFILQLRYTPGGNMMDGAFNPKEVKKEELISWYDLLKPKFKGKMNLQDPSTAGKGGKWVNESLTYYGLDWDYMKALAKQEPVITRDQRIMIEWIVKGKHIIAINPHNEQYEIFKQAGAELDYAIFKETRATLGGGSYNLALIDKPAHPKAVMLFANWFLSKEGQTIISRAAGIQSAREDIPTDHLTENHIRQPGMEYVIETEEFVVRESKLRPIVLEVFGPLLK